MLVHPTVEFFGKVDIGENVRIDAFCVLTGNIKIGSHVHIACGGYFFGTSGIVIEDFAQISNRISVFSQADDFYGNCLVGPQIPLKFKPNLKSGLVTLARHVLIGSNVTVMPSVVIGEGTSIGAHSFVSDDCLPWSIYAGVPAKKIGERKKDMLKYEEQFLAEYKEGVKK